LKQKAPRRGAFFNGWVCKPVAVQTLKYDGIPVIFFLCEYSKAGGLIGLPKMKALATSN
jgi:hypothetical protein